MKTPKHTCLSRRSPACFSILFKDVLQRSRNVWCCHKTGSRVVRLTPSVRIWKVFIKWLSRWNKWNLSGRDQTRVYSPVLLNLIYSKSNSTVWIARDIFWSFEPDTEPQCLITKSTAVALGVESLLVHLGSRQYKPRAFGTLQTPGRDRSQLEWESIFKNYRKTIPSGVSFATGTSMSASMRSRTLKFAW